MSAADRQEIVDACQILYRKDLTDRYTGHISKRLDDGVLIPKHTHEQGLGLGSVDAEDVILVDIDGDPLEDDSVEAPSEFTIHSSILKARPEITSVCHTHPLHATGLSMTNQTVVPASLDSTVFEHGVAQFDSGPNLIHDTAQSDAMVDAMGQSRAVLVRGHGVVTCGETVAEAMARVFLLERATKLQLIANQFGGVQRFDAFDEVGATGFMEDSSGEFFERVFDFFRAEVL